MNNFLLQLKIKQRLNKLASGDYDNIECWQIVEAFNKVQLDWVRGQLVGNNVRKEGDEQSKRLVDDLQVLLQMVKLKGMNKLLFFESVFLPEDYLGFKRVVAFGSREGCEGNGGSSGGSGYRDWGDHWTGSDKYGFRRIRVDLAEEANVEDCLRDVNTRPSWEWGETFCTLMGNRVRVYTNDVFKVERAELTYYRVPRLVLIAGCVNPGTGEVTVKDSECEFKDDVAEVLVDLTAGLLAGDLESFNQMSRNKGSGDANN